MIWWTCSGPGAWSVYRDRALVAQCLSEESAMAAVRLFSETVNTNRWLEHRDMWV